MQTITSAEQIAGLQGNSIIGNIEITNSKILFLGSGNVLFCANGQDGEPVRLRGAQISFRGDNSVVFLSRSRKPYIFSVTIYHNSFCYMGADSFFNGAYNKALQLQCSEQSNLWIGEHCLFSFGVWVRTSDAHMIFDAQSHKRINSSKSVFIGDHVWLGQDAKIWKGSQIGSGAVIGADAFLTGKRVPSNTVWGGNPAKLVRRGVFYLPDCVHAYRGEDMQKQSEYPHDTYLYSYDSRETMDFLELEQTIKKFATARERAAFLLELSAVKEKNRFYIGEL